jgi:outer membrane lipoprotein-sorting protein
VESLGGRKKVAMKRCAVLAVGWLAAASLLPAPAQDKEAEKLFRDMEKKITSAKAIEIDFTYQLEGKTTKGTLLLTNDNKARLQVSGHFYFGVKGNARFELVSDGRRLKTKGARLLISTIGRPYVEPGGQTEGKTPKSFHALLAVTLSRGGIGATILGLPYLVGADDDIDPDKEDSRMTVHDFEAVGAEKVGERPAKVVRYRFGKGGNDDPKVAVWIDAESGLPLKRVFLGGPEGEKIRISESYSEIKLNPKVDAKAFELPK